MRDSGLPCLVLTCDRYAWTWKTFWNRWTSYEPSGIGTIYWISESLHPSFNCVVSPRSDGGVDWSGDPRCRAISTGIHNWSDQLISVVRSIETITSHDRVLIMLEDFWISPVAKTLDFGKLLSIAREISSPMLGIHSDSGYYTTQKRADSIPFEYGGETAIVRDFSPGSKYQTSLQPTIWTLSALAKLLRRGESPWDFEIKGTRRAWEMNLSRSFVAVDWYSHGVKRGKLTPAGEKIFKEESGDVSSGAARLR